MQVVVTFRKDPLAHGLEEAGSVEAGVFDAGINGVGVEGSVGNGAKERRVEPVSPAFDRWKADGLRIHSILRLEAKFQSNLIQYDERPPKYLDFHQPLHESLSK